MAEPCRIRPSSPADLPALIDLERRCFTDPWSWEQLTAVMREPGSIGEVAVAEDGELLGHLIGRIVVDQGEILSVAVSPLARRQGIAGALLDSTLRQMKQRGVVSVWLEVRQSNSEAQRLYVGRGFNERGRRRGYYQRPPEDALVMARDLSEDAS